MSRKQDPDAEAREELVARLREHLAPEQPQRELSMFGGRAFMVRDKMVVCAMRGGVLLVRVSAEDDPGLLDRPGAARGMMGPDRDMGPGWITVTPESLRTEDDLDSWLRPALDHNLHVTKG